MIHYKKNKMKEKLTANTKETLLRLAISIQDTYKMYSDNLDSVQTRRLDDRIKDNVDTMNEVIKMNY